MPDGKKIASRVVMLRKERDTPGTYVYKEDQEADLPLALKTFYIQRWALTNDPPPRLRITIEPVYDED